MNSRDQLSLVLECFLLFAGGGGLAIHNIGKVGPLPCIWPYRWAIGVTTYTNGVITLPITGDLVADDIVSDEFRILIAQNFMFHWFMALIELTTHH